MSEGQGFVGRNRPPRVHVKYDTELYGADRKDELPFVMGVMSDLAGKSNKKQKPLSQRKFLDVDAETLNKRMDAIEPRVDFEVDNELTEGGGKLKVDLSFKNMKDFSPARVAERAGGLDALYKTRNQLENFLANVSGKDDVKLKILEALNDPAKLQALVSGKADAAPAETTTEESAPETEGSNEGEE